MRRVGFSGRAQILRPVAHTKSAKTHTACNKKQGKTGIFCKKRACRSKITQPALEHSRGFLSIYTLLAPKFPTKITGNYPRISGNNNIVCIQNIFIFRPRTKVSSLSMNCLKRKEGPTLIQLAQLNALWQNWYSIHK